jgi:hypothetical protein
MKNKIALALAALATLAALPASASEEKKAEEGPEFGNPGVINIAAATSLDLTFGSSKEAEGGKSSITQFSITPSIDYFVVEGVSVGALLGYAHRSEKPEGATDADTASSWVVGPRVGYNLWLTPGRISLWPLLAFEYRSTSTTSGGKDGPTLSTGAVDLFVPVVFHPVPHFHLAVGPYFTLDVTSKAKLTNGESVDGKKDTLFGLRGEVAGWL